MASDKPINPNLADCLHTVTVGDLEVAVNDAEWFVANARKGLPVEANVSRIGKPRQTVRGVFSGSYYYDGVVGRIDVGDREVGVFPALGDTIREMRLDEEMPFAGDGI